MGTQKQHFYLLLIFALVLSPMQSLFASPQIDEESVTVTMMSPAPGNMIQSDMLKMLGDDCCNNLGECGNCQNSTQCGSCNVLSGISQSMLMRSELNEQTQFAISNISLYNADLLPDYRPPRYS